MYYRRKAAVLAVLLLVAVAYSIVQFRLRTFTGRPVLDGAIGIVLGLFLASRPAANLVDLLFYRQTSLRQPTSGWAGASWLSLNALVLLMSWFLLATGAAHLATRSR